jgi:hypothetical protein
MKHPLNKEAKPSQPQGTDRKQKREQAAVIKQQVELK